MKTKIYYVVDPMCGWCYGFSDVITKIYEKYKSDFDFNILPGGMWVGENIKRMDRSLGSYIKSHNERMEPLTGKKFGEGFNKNILESENVVLDSLPGSKALILMQRLKGDTAFSFLKKIQEAFFFDGKDMNRTEVYSQIAEEFGVPKEEFEKEFLLEGLTRETFEYFDKAAAMGVASFPTVIVVEGNRGSIVSQGYRSFEEMDMAFGGLKSSFRG